MAKSKPKPKKHVDPELERQLAESGEDTPVQAVFTLRSKAGRVGSSDDAKNTVAKVVEQATSGAKSSPHRLTVFPNIRSFAVSASPSFVKCVLKSPEIASAMANVQRQDLFIRPVKVKRIKKKR